jgi:hypothetical protein
MERLAGLVGKLDVPRIASAQHAASAAISEHSVSHHKEDEAAN